MPPAGLQRSIPNVKQLRCKTDNLRLPRPSATLKCPTRCTIVSAGIACVLPVSQLPGNGGGARSFSVLPGRPGLACNVTLLLISPLLRTRPARCWPRLSTALWLLCVVPFQVVWKVQQQHRLHNLSPVSPLAVINRQLNMQLSQVFRIVNRTGDLNEENIIKISKWVWQTFLISVCCTDLNTITAMLACELLCVTPVCKLCTAA